MAKTSATETNARRAKLAKRYSARRAKLRAIIHDRTLTGEERFAAQLKLQQLPRNSNPNRVRNRCEVSGRPRAYYRKFKMSRIALRQLASLGLVPGVVKASW